MINGLLFGAGGAAARNFRKAVDIGCETNNIDIHWYLMDDNFYNLQLCNKDNASIMNSSLGLEEAVNEYKIDFVHSQPEQGVVKLIESQSMLGNIILKNNMQEYNMFRDKYQCQLIWREKLEVPFWIYDVNNLSKKKFDKICKNKTMWMRARTGAGSKAALPIKNWKQLVGWKSYWDQKDPGIEFILSDVLPGPEFAVQTFWINGELYIAQARQRVDYLFANQMPSGQSSTPSISVSSNRNDVYDTAIEAILAITPRPHGIYGVDIKTTADERLMPTEINYGRFYTTSHQYAELALDPLNIPFDYFKYIVYKEIPNKRINSLPANIYHVRGLDSEGAYWWKKLT